MILLALLCAHALAGTVYINGVRADVLPEATLKNVTVRMDANGDIWIDAPQYRVESVAPSPTMPATASGAVGTTASSASTGPIPPGVWWLVSEDHQSTGEALAVTINGAPVYRVVSGQGPIVVDLAPYLRRGNNDVRIEPVANGTLGGGSLDLYVGHGVNDGGTLRIDQTLLRYSRSPSDPVGPRGFTVYVP